MLPPVVIREAVKVAKITETGGQERLLAPVEAAHIGLVWRLARRKLSGHWAGWVDMDPFEVPADQGATPRPVRVAKTPSFVAKKLKMAHILDQGDESEFTLADAGHITFWFHNFVAITHGQPDEDEISTNEQLSALNVRVIFQLGSLYADFAVFTPYERKTTRAHRFTAYLPQQDGSWLAKEIPGPTNYQAWLYCGRVFRVACLMLKVAHEMPLDRFQRKIEKLANNLAPCLFGRRQVQVRAFQSFKVLNRVRHFSRTSRSADVGRWFSVACNFLEGSRGRRNLLGRQHSTSCHELVGTRWQRRSQSSRATGWGGGACRRYGGARPRNVSSSRGRELLGSWHFDQSHGTPDQEGEDCGVHSRCEERSWASTCKEVKGQERRTGRKEQRSALHSRSSWCTVVFQLEFRWWDMWRAFTGSPCPAGRIHKCTTCRSDKHTARQCPHA